MEYYERTYGNEKYNITSTTIVKQLEPKWGQTDRVKLFDGEGERKIEGMQIQAEHNKTRTSTCNHYNHTMTHTNKCNRKRHK